MTSLCFQIKAPKPSRLSDHHTTRKTRGPNLKDFRKKDPDRRRIFRGRVCPGLASTLIHSVSKYLHLFPVEMASPSTIIIFEWHMPNHPSSHAAVQWFIIIDWCKVQSTHDQPVHQAEDQRGGERTEKTRTSSVYLTLKLGSLTGSVASIRIALEPGNCRSDRTLSQTQPAVLCLQMMNSTALTYRIITSCNQHWIHVRLPGVSNSSPGELRSCSF